MCTHYQFSHIVNHELSNGQVIGSHTANMRLVVKTRPQKSKVNTARPAETAQNVANNHKHNHNNKANLQVVI